MLDWIVIIMRAEPLHIMHEALISLGLEKAKNVIILLGSANRSRSPKNPWKWQERAIMVLNAFEDQMGRIEVEPLDDFRYNDQKWCHGVQTSVGKYVNEGDTVGLLTYVKDKSGYYQSMFGQWQTVNVAEEMHERFPDLAGKLNATDIRKAYFKWSSGWEKFVSPAVAEYLTNWRERDEFQHVNRDFEYCENYKEKMSQGAYPPFIMCADACVIKNGHILLIRRGKYPGKGQWALPGGHVDIDEKVKNAVYRELKEETQLDLNGIQPKAHKLFDDPERSAKGRVLSMAYLFQLPVDGPMPEVIASDDAEWAGMVPLADLDNPWKPYRGNFHDDHEDIIGYFRGLI